MNIIDKALVMAYLNTRDEYSFRLLYKRHASAMWNMAFKLCPGDLLAAEEITQNAWMRAVMNLEKFEWRSSLRTWLIGIVINSAREENRTKTLKTSLQPEIVEGLKTEEKQINDTMPLIEKLPEGYRTILLLHDLEGYKHEEIASMLDIAVGTSKSQLHQARKAFRLLYNTHNV